ncbi:MAG: hypothetical protein AVDCRST_MAG37-2299 [uncultured Rubrobacteraceae bacterium]|uniref:Uncharacterized protein n=1 Tax=uncultured Rubrobacteraceae bacterium TaxID=349277 RepID=A0A6J4QP11_9ACTN|nr:MAG: hypothetical protein AVDCRST_MAG37-2299 [uncultured Rubrobacteraceae bacterium]
MVSYLVSALGIAGEAFRYQQSRMGIAALALLMAYRPARLRS